MKVVTANFRELYFEHQDITRIDGESTFAALHNMVLQLKSNAVYGMGTLGDGVYGYIFIIMSPVTDATLDPLSLFIVPAPPGPINVTDNATQHEI